VLDEGSAARSATTGDLARRVAASAPGLARADEEALYRRFAPRVRLYGLRHLGCASAADDLVQEVMLATFDSLREGRVRDPDQLGSFILGCARLTVQNPRRGNARRAALLARWATPAEAFGGEPIAPERLEDCLHRLGERERTVLSLTFYADRSAAEIAHELATSDGNVRVIRHRALASLAGCLDGRGGAMT
jgi:RNA polymerase sigma-70 factor (ECF subfamily)